MLAVMFAAAAVAAPQPATISTADGVALHATVDGDAASKKGVVLVHMEARMGSDWDYLAKRLASSGMRTVAPDLRGHGASPRPPELSDDDFSPMLEDVKASVAWLRDQGVTNISCAGAGIGANLCMRVAAGDTAISNIVLLSPGLKVKNVATLDVIEQYGDRPMLIVASTEDRYSSISAEKIEARAKGEKVLQMLSRAGHGTKMLNRNTQLEGIVVDWLVGQAATGSSVGQRAGMTGDVKRVTTTGETLDNRKD